MSDYNAADTRKIRAARRLAKAVEAERRIVVINLMSTTAGRNWIHNILEYGHIFSTTFTGEALSSAFREGQRDVGLHILLDVVQNCPDQYIQMMREVSDKEIADGHRRTDPDSGSLGPSQDSGPDSGGALSDYDPDPDS